MESRSARHLLLAGSAARSPGGDNGSVIYWVIFTPDEEAAKLYAPCEIEMSVQTQIGVNVEFTADSRDYVKDSTEATGTYRLVDADRGIVYEELQLTGGQMEFSQNIPGKDLQVVFYGYQLENDSDGLYVLLNESAKSTAEIRWIQPVLETAPTVNGTVTGGTALRDVEVTGGRAVYKVEPQRLSGSSRNLDLGYAGPHAFR